jgi:putative oxidoreductase
MAHGWAKLSRGPSGFAKLLEQIGAPLPELTAWVSTLVEILGGLAILAGAFVAVVSVPLIVMMLVAMFTVHLRYGFSAINTIGLTAAGPQFGPPGYEVNLLYIAGLLALILGGAGPLSIDRLLARGKREPAAVTVHREGDSSRGNWCQFFFLLTGSAWRVCLLACRASPVRSLMVSSTMPSTGATTALPSSARPRTTWPSSTAWDRPKSDTRSACVATA